MSTSYPKPGGGPQRPPMAASKDGFGAPPSGAPRRPPIGAGAGPVGAPAGARSGRPPISHSQYQAPPAAGQYGYNPQAFPGYGGVMGQQQPFFPHGMYAGGAPMMPPSGGAPSGPAPSMVAPSQAGRPMYGGPVGVPRASAAPSKGPVASKPTESESRSMDAPSRPPAASSRRPPVVPSQPESVGVSAQSSQYGAHPSMLAPQAAQRGPVGAPTMASDPSGAPIGGATRPPMAAAGKPPMAATEMPAPVQQSEIALSSAAVGAPASGAATSAGVGGSAEMSGQPSGVSAVAQEKEADPADSAPKPWAPFTGAKKNPVFSSWAAQVRFVISGDTVKLALHKPPAKKYDPSKIILFTLEGLRAPRLPRRSGKGAEGDAFGFEARDFVRSVVAKKPVFFAVWRAMKESRGASTTSAQWRYFGDIYVPDESGNLSSLSDTIVANGWAQVKLRDGIPAADWSLTDDEYNRLQKAQEKAKKNKIGRWAEAKPAQRVVKEINQKDNKKFFKRFDKQTVDAVVEKALSGSFFRIEIIPSDPTGVYESVLVYLAGAQCNRLAGAGAPSAPFAAEALDWSESRVVGQKVKVTFLALDRKDNLYVKMDHPRGQLAESLLRNGLAYYEAWTAVLTGSVNQKRLLDSVKAASDAQLNLYETTPFVDKQDEFRATVTQVMSGDTIIVTTETGEERRFLLASIRAPRRLPLDGLKKRSGGSGGDESKIDERKELEERTKEDKFVFAAKNFVRELIIGKQVTVKSEYERKMGDSDLQYASILLGKTNVSVALLKEGLAAVIKHRKEDSKSMFYKQLQDAEDAAKRAKKGLFGKQVPEPATDLTQNMADKMTIVELIALNNSIEGKLVTAVVEYVFRADRIKLYLPKQNVFIVCSLSGVRSGNDEWGQQATDFVRSKIFQRTVQFRLDAVLNMESLGSGATPSDSPKKGGRRRGGKKGGRRATQDDNRGPRSPQYIGDVFYNETGKKGGSVNIAHELVTLGLTKIVHRRERRQMGRRFEMVEMTDPALVALENAACEAEVGLWKEESKRLAEREAERKAKYQTGKDKVVKVTYIATAVTFWVIETDNMATMQRVAESLDELKPVRVTRPKVGTVVAAMYDGQFARARIERQVPDKDNAYLVLFLDYGNRATVTASDMAVLPPELALSTLEPLAHRCCLAGLRTPPRSSQLHYWRGAGNRFAELAMGVTLNCKVLYDDYDDRKWYVDLSTESGTSINRTLVSEGLARTDPKRLENPEALYGSESAPEAGLYLRELESLQKDAFTKMKNMWTNGEVADE